MTLHAVEVDHVSKRFTKHSEPTKTIKERFLASRKNVKADFWALDDVAFDVGVGETIGLLGHNGSGKSTLLKCIAGTLRPTSGAVRVRGRIAALLELGAGFHPELSGRENIYLNGSILGFSRQRIDRIFDDIVAFSELEDFIDEQVKHYSSGMYARLGFAVAVNVEPDVLLVDEVLAVGDEAFQAKCLDRVRRFQADGRTIILVTHSPDLAQQMCDRVVVLDHGKQIFDGDTGEAARLYRQSLERKSSIAEVAAAENVQTTGGRSMSVVIKDVTIDPPPDGVVHRPHDPVRIRVSYESKEPVDGVRARLALHAHDGVLLTNVSSHDLGGDIGLVDGEGETVWTIESFPLMDGRYMVSAFLQDQTEQIDHDRRPKWVHFDVQADGGYTGRVAFKIGQEHRTVG